MDWPTFTVEIVKALAWPGATITGLVMLRQPIAGLIPLMQKLKYKDLELEFGKQVQEAKEEAAEELPASTVVAALPSGQSDPIRELARVSPRSAVLESWRGVEAASLEAASRNGISLGFRDASSPVRVIRALERASVVEPGFMGLFHDLRGLRNQAAHAPDFALSADAAMEYAQLARSAAEYLRTAKANDQGEVP
jgi:hypothetical protein